MRSSVVNRYFFFPNIFAFIQKQTAFLADFLFFNHSTDSVTEVKIRLLKNSCLCFKVGVALLVGILFALNIGLELLFDAICEKCEDMFGAKKIHKVENPAALVGTFKRYK